MIADQLILLWIQAHQIPALGVLMRGISRFSGPEGCLVMALVISCLLIIVERTWRKPVMFMVGTMIGGALSSGLKAVIARARPPLGASAAHSYSFPSGHAFMSTVLFGLLAWAIVPKYSAKRGLWKSLAVAGAFLVGLSRIYLSVHWTTDVLGGWFLGAFFVFIWLRLWKACL